MMMKAESQIAWVMVRAIGLLILLYSVTCFIAAASSAHMAFSLRDHRAIVIRSDAPIPDHQKDTPQNRQLIWAQGQAQAAATLNGVLFLISITAALYCLRGGKAVHNILMPPKDNETPNQPPEGTR
jgi:hypothetical protein